MRADAPFRAAASSDRAARRASAGAFFDPAAAPFAFSLYGGLPMTTVIRSSFLTLFASRREIAIGS